MGQLDAAHRAMVQRPCTIHHHDLDLAAACVHAHGLVGVGARMADDKEQAPSTHDDDGVGNTIKSATSFSDLSISHACGDGTFRPVPRLKCPTTFPSHVSWTRAPS